MDCLDWEAIGTFTGWSLRWLWNAPSSESKGSGCFIMRQIVFSALFAFQCHFLLWASHSSVSFCQSLSCSSELLVPCLVLALHTPLAITSVTRTGQCDFFARTIAAVTYSSGLVIYSFLFFSCSPRVLSFSDPFCFLLLPFSSFLDELISQRCGKWPF